MIEYLTVDDKDIPISINADTTVTEKEQLTWFQLARELNHQNSKYFVRSEGTLYFDDNPAVSPAAQLITWIHTNIPKGRQIIYIPGDTHIYRAELDIHDYIIVQNEQLCTLDDAINLIKQEPKISIIHESGKLQITLKQQKIECKDLQINLVPDRSNPYYLRRGYTLNELILATTASVLVISALAGITQWLFTEDEKPLIAAVEKIIVPNSTTQIQDDLAALPRLMSAAAVLFNYGMTEITVTPSRKGYKTRIDGSYENQYPLPRLEQIANLLNGNFTLAGKTWSIQSDTFKPASAAELPMIDTLDALQRYRRLSGAGNAQVEFGPINNSGTYKTTTLELIIEKPLPEQIKQIAAFGTDHMIHGQPQHIELTTTSGNGWETITLHINITGT